MTVHLPYPDPFNCAICLTPRGDGATWQRFGDRHRRDMPPICWRCEQEWGTGPYGIDTMLDHRLKRQLSAMANAIAAEASSRKMGYGGLYGRT